MTLGVRGSERRRAAKTPPRAGSSRFAALRQNSRLRRLAASPRAAPRAHDAALRLKGARPVSQSSVLEEKEHK